MGRVTKPPLSVVLYLFLLLWVLLQLIHEVDKKTGEAKAGAPRFVREGALVVAQLKVARSVCVETFDDMQQLGRFTLRDAGARVWGEAARWRRGVTLGARSSLCASHRLFRYVCAWVSASWCVVCGVWCMAGRTIAIGKITKLPRVVAPGGAGGGGGGAAAAPAPGASGGAGGGAGAGAGAGAAR